MPSGQASLDVGQVPVVGRDQLPDRLRAIRPDGVRLDRLWRERGLTLILVTHDSAVARRAQRIGLMRAGHLSIRQDTRA